MDYATREGVKTNLVENGGKIMMLECPDHKLKFLDSLNFITMPLKKLPTSFGVTELKKGYFLYLFNVVGNQNYIGKMPDIEYFDPDGMSSSEKEDFSNGMKKEKMFQTIISKKK